MLLHCCLQSVNVVLEKIVQGIWRAKLNWSAGRMRSAGRMLATTGLQVSQLQSLQPLLPQHWSRKVILHHWSMLLQHCTANRL